MFNQAGALINHIRNSGLTPASFSSKEIDEYEKNLQKDEFINLTLNTLYLRKNEPQKLIISLLLVAFVNYLRGEPALSITWVTSVLSVIFAHNLYNNISKSQRDQDLYYRINRDEILAYAREHEHNLINVLTPDMQNWVENGGELIAQFKERSNIDENSIFPQDLCCKVSFLIPDLPVLLGGRCYDYSTLDQISKTTSIDPITREKFTRNQIQAYRNWPDHAENFLKAKKIEQEIKVPQQDNQDNIVQETETSSLRLRT